MNKKILFSVFAVSIVVVLGVSLVLAFPFGEGFANAELSDEDKAEMDANREAMNTAIENEDYEAWKALMEERIAKMQESLTEENFEKMIERHQEMEEFRAEMEEARENGDFEQMEELREDFDLKGPGFGRRGGHFGDREDCPMNAEE